MNSPAPDGHVVRFEASPKTLALVFAFVAGLWLIYKLWIVVLLLVLALVWVGTFNPIVERMEARGIKRGKALVLLMLSLGLGCALLIFLTVPALIEQLTTIASELPSRRESLISALGRHKLAAPLVGTLRGTGLQEGIARLQSQLVGYWPIAVRGIGYAFTTFFLSFYFLADGKRTRGALYAFVPRDYHMRLARIIHNLETIVGGYMRGQLITSVAFGAFTFIILAAFGVRNALAFSLLAMLTDVIPFGGALLTTIPAVFTAMGRGPTTAASVLVCMLLYQQFESRVLVPKVYGEVLRLSPAAVILALISGGTLLGLVGALLALPLAAALKMILEELGVAMPGDDSDDPSGRARDQKTEAAYELMSAGSSAPDAGQIADELASGIRDADAWVRAKKKAP